MEYTSNFDKLYQRFPKELRDKMSRCIQDKIYHPEGSVQMHTQHVFENVFTVFPGDIDFNDLIISSLFHDIGKIDTREVKIKDGVERVSHIEHEYKSLDYIEEYFHLFSDITTNKEKVREIVKNHMKAHLYNDLKMKKESKRKAFQENKYFLATIKFSTCDTQLIE